MCGIKFDVNKAIAEARAKSEAKLAADIAEIEYKGKMIGYCPDGFETDKIGKADYNGVTTYRYEAKNASDVAAIMAAWRSKYSVFKEIGKYSKFCATVTAYPYKEFLDEDALKANEADAVMARNSKGNGFSNVEFNFFPEIEGEKIEVEITMGFRCYLNGFEGCIVKNGRSGRVIRKDAPKNFSEASYGVLFGGGSEDSADWRGVFRYDTFLNVLSTTNSIE